MHSIYYKESLMLLRTYVAAFVLLVLQGFYIKQKELIGHKLILILQGIKVVITHFWVLPNYIFFSFKKKQLEIMPF